MTPLKLLAAIRVGKKRFIPSRYFNTLKGTKMNHTYLLSLRVGSRFFLFYVKRYPLYSNFPYENTIFANWSSLLTITKLRVIIMDVEGSRKKKYLANSLPFNSSFPGNDNFIVTDFYLILSGLDQIRGTGGQTRTNHNQSQGK